jgi:hypothetical protein
MDEPKKWLSKLLVVKTKLVNWKEGSAADAAKCIGVLPLMSLWFTRPLFHSSSSFVITAVAMKRVSK